MADLLTKKNWKFSTNKTLKTNGPSSHDARRRDVADFFAVLVRELIELSKVNNAPRITVAQSSDGVGNTFDNPNAANKNTWIKDTLTDLEIANGNIASTNFKNTVYNSVSNAYPSNSTRRPCAWIILNFDAGAKSKNTGQLCISLGSYFPPFSENSGWPTGAANINSSSGWDITNRFFTVSWSKTGFTFPFSSTWNSALPAPWTGSTWTGRSDHYSRATLKPIAIDEEILVFNSVYDNDGGVIFNGIHYNQNQAHSTNTSWTTGIIGSNAMAPTFNQKLHIGLAENLSAFYVAAFRDNKHTFFMWFGDMEDGIKSSARDWTQQRFCLVNGGQPFTKQFGYPIYDQYSSLGSNCFNGIQIRCSLDKDGVKAVIPSVCGINGPNANFGQGLANVVEVYCGAPLSSLVGYGHKDAEVDQFPIYPFQIFSQKFPGIKGSLTDIWWGTYGGNCCVYPSTYSMTGASGIKFIQISDIVVPWDGVSIPQFSE